MSVAASLGQVSQDTHAKLRGFLELLRLHMAYPLVWLLDDPPDKFSGFFLLRFAVNEAIIGRQCVLQHFSVLSKLDTRGYDAH